MGKNDETLEDRCADLEDSTSTEASASHEFRKYKLLLEATGAMPLGERLTALKEVYDGMLSITKNVGPVLGIQSLVRAGRAASGIARLDSDKLGWLEKSYRAFERALHPSQEISYDKEHAILHSMGKVAEAIAFCDLPIGKKLEWAQIAFDYLDKSVKKAREKNDHCHIPYDLAGVGDIASFAAVLESRHKEKIVWGERALDFHRAAAESCPEDKSFNRFFGIACSAAAQDATILARMIGGGKSADYWVEAYRMRRTAEEALREINRRMAQEELYEANGIALRLQETHPNQAERQQWRTTAREGIQLMSRIYSRR